MFERINQIVQAETSDLRELAKAAGANYKTFWRGADFEGVDLRGQDLRDFDLGDASLKGAITDASTRLPPGKAKNASGAKKKAAPAPVSQSSRLAPHIPYLRRYARALCGSQATGDAYIAAVLEAVIADPSSYDEGEDGRLSLYKLFSSLWQAVAIGEDRHPVPSSVNDGPTLQMLAPLPRQAYLLGALEGFSLDQISWILEMDHDEIADLIDKASTFIGHQLSANVMIIEDEPLIAMDLEQIVERLGYRVTGIARTHKEALALFAKDPPGMVLADLQLADGSSGLEAVKEIHAKRPIPVIFITAFPERLLKMDRPEPAFLVTKPFDVGTVKAIITQAALHHSGINGWV